MCAVKWTAPLQQPTRRLLCQRSAAFCALGAIAPFAQAAISPSPRRIVSIGGALTEILFALDAQRELVGVDTTSLFPESVNALPRVGYARTLSSEGILALAPTQVVATEDAGPPAVLRQITASGVPVTVLPAKHRFEGMLERVQRLGEVTGRGPQALSLVERLKTEWAQSRSPILARKTTGPRVMFVLSHSPSQAMVGGQGSSAQAMLHYAGATNAVQGFEGFKPLTPEAVIAAKPDVVLFTDQGLTAVGGMAGALKLPGLGQTPAGQQRRIVALEAMFLLGFGPRLPQALSALDETLQRAMQR